MKAMIFAAGLGTRLRPYTDTMPKALVPVDGKPMIWHQVRKLKAAGVDEVVVNVHHFAKDLVSYIHGENDFGITVHISDESGMLLDTGGGLLAARRFLEAVNEPFLIHNVDIFSNLDLAAFISDGLQDGSVAKLLVSDRDSSRKLLFDADGSLCGWKNLRTGELRGPVASAVGTECDATSVGDSVPRLVTGVVSGDLRELAFGGVHLVSHAIFDVFDRHPEFTGAFSIIEFYLAVCAENHISAYCPADLKLVDVGKVSSLDTLDPSLLAR